MEMRRDVETSVLFDTGALCSNYISIRKFRDIEKHMHTKDIIHKRTKVGLADNKTVAWSDIMVRLTLKFEDRSLSAVSCKYSGEFIVLDMKDNEIIIGLPAILGDLWDFFCYSLKGNAERKIRTSVPDAEEEMLQFLASMDNVVHPWSNSMEGEPPEEEMSPLPVQFGEVIKFLGKSREEAIQEFKDLMPEHIAEDFDKATPVRELLLNEGLKVFVPETWTGIRGVEPLKLTFKDTLPQRLKPKARPINPRLWEAAEKEFLRLRGYMYEKSRSPWASCLVVAPKATKPFIRFCGDYVEINRHIHIGNYTIPNIRHQLDRIMGYKVFLDIDLTNAFHQIPLHEETAEKLSIQTPWGQYQPRFMPEGIGPATGVLQETVNALFSDLPWAIVIFDNILLLATDYQEAYERLKIFIERCIQHNVILKFAKSWLGFGEVKFFGYRCKHQSFELTEDRKAALLEIPFPESGNRSKKIRSLLGCGVFFAPFVKNYSEKVRHLTDLTKPEFDWSDESKWEHDYRQEFEDFKKDLQEACALHYPDYELPWVIRTDASEIGVGGVLIQIKTHADGSKEEQIIALISKRFSKQAQKWDTIEQEGFAIYYVVKRLAYYLIGKEFLLETDHNNLRWIEASEVPKIIRWRIYLQSFVFKVRHIPGKENVLADTLSRLHLCVAEEDEHEDCHTAEGLCHLCNEDDEFEEEELEYEQRMSTLCNMFDEEEVLGEEVKPTPNHLQLTPTECLDQVHNAQVGHWGERETWRRLNRDFPGHGISQRQVKDYIDRCANCQKTRREMKTRLIPVQRHLKPPSHRTAIGIDALAITPHGRNGETHINVIVNLFTELAFLNPVKGCSAKTLADSVWKYWANFGFTDMIISDLGPDLNSALFKELTDLVGVRHVFSIANKHVNGCERVNKEVGRHLRALVYDTREKDVFDDPTFIPSVQIILNTHRSAETNYTPFELTFGTPDSIYSDLAKKFERVPEHLYLQKMHENLHQLRNASRQYQETLIKKRVEDPNQRMGPQNKFQKGDLVLYDPGVRPVPKLSTKRKGPFEVVHQYKNDVDCRNVLTGAIHKYSVTDLEYFVGSKEDAVEAAIRDQEQFRVKVIHGYKGDSNHRTSMTFIVEYADGDILEVPWSRDLFDCQAYEDFCKSRKYLHHLILDQNQVTPFKTQLRRADVTAVQVGDRVYVDLRFFGDQWYQSLDLPDFSTKSYVVVFEYTHWYHRTSKKKISARFLLNGATYALDNYLVFAWGSVKTFDETYMVLVDADIAKRYPRIVE